MFLTNPQKLLHVGAHKGEELEDYSAIGWDSVTWIEANPQLVSDLKKILPQNQEVIEAAIFDIDDLFLQLKVTNNSQSSSLFDLGTHKKTYPDIQVTREITVKTKRLDTIFKKNFDFDFINLDIQGAELNALRSLGENIRKLKYIYLEVNKREVYVGCSSIKMIDLFLEKEGFRRAATKWEFGAGWGDAIYLRTNTSLPLSNQVHIFLKYRLMPKILSPGKLFKWCSRKVIKRSEII